MRRLPTPGSVGKMAVKMGAGASWLKLTAVDARWRRLMEFGASCLRLAVVSAGAHWCLPLNLGAIWE